MTIRVGCQCGKRFAAPDHLAGKSVPCPSCGSPILIAAPPAKAAALAPIASDDPFGPLSPLPAAQDDLWNSLPQQAAWPPPQPAWQPPAFAPPAQDFRASVHSSLAQDYMASAHQQNVEQKGEMDAWGTGKIVSGILMMTFACVWFFGGLLFGIIFFFPPVLFIAGLIALINGLLQKVNR